MIVKCYNCGLIREATKLIDRCPECGFYKWYELPTKRTEMEKVK